MTDAKATGAALRDKVEAEAAAAEAETPEEEPVEQPAEEQDGEEEAAEEEPAQEPEPAGRRGKSPQEQFERAFAAFRKKCADVFEVPLGEIVTAPHPGVVGIMLPGFAEPRTHDNYKRCDTCNGLGKVLTSAQTGDPAKDWHVCPDQRCKGQGYWTRSTAVEQQPATGPLAVGVQPQPNGEYAEAPTWLGDPTLTPQA